MTTNEPDLFAVVRWAQGLADPEERFTVASRMADQVRDEVLTELAALRRSSAMEARTKLMATGLSATAATRALAERVGVSPQTIYRMITERGRYGVEEVNNE